MVPQIKLKEYTTLKQDVPKGIFKRPLPEYIVPDNEDPPVILPPIEEKKETKNEEKKVEETKTLEAPLPVPSEDRKQTIAKPLPPVQPQSEPEKIVEQQHTPSFTAPEVPKPAPQQQQNLALESKTF